MATSPRGVKAARPKTRSKMLRQACPGQELHSACPISPRAPRLRRAAGSRAECHDAHQHNAYRGRSQRDEEQAAEAVSHALRARGSR
jgi:hypothetical protein